VAAGVFSIPLEADGWSPSPSTDRGTTPALKLREFFAGEENALCRVAAESLFHDPPAYNPLVFFGCSGTGKSTLVRGLAARWRQHNRTAKTIITTGSEFAREYRHAVETDSVSDLRTKYRRAALLVVDDLEAVGEKTSVQQELIHTLQALLEHEHRVVATLSQAPLDSGTLLPGLASRLSAGLTVPLVPPGPAARRHILRQLARTYDLSLPDAVYEYIAARQTTNSATITVPDLERLMAHLAGTACQQGRPLDVASTRQLLAALEATTKTPLRSITKLVCEYFNLRSADLKGKTRRQRVVRARGVAMLLARQLTNESLEQVGRHFGNRDHTTVLHACRKTESLITHDPAIRQAVEELSLQLTTA
jgi:chromosomal replication initiator protein